MGLRKSLLQLSGFVGISLLLGACSNTPVQEPDLPEREYYQNAQEAFDQGRPLVAVKNLKDLDSRYPFGEFSQRAELELIYAYFLASDYISAHANAERFIKKYPDFETIDYVFYYRALSTFKGDQTLSARFLNQDPSQRDTSEFVKAFREFADLLKRFPESSYANDAKSRMIYLRNTIAKHELQVAKYYFKRDAPLAALHRSQTVLNQYPSSDSIEEALAVSVQAYIELEQEELAGRSLAILVENYPDSTHLDENGQLIIPARPKDADPDFWYWVTLGWMD
ncbi:outer membrane protein assembly factor BamD [Marinomonas sp. PE14-40]|uniref:outer membrane protein assembly factor BamD n=1 Tax=Marinomonas sp. PE14-40 TaxID=3060621 RepID=UPI003F669BB6